MKTTHRNTAPNAVQDDWHDDAFQDLYAMRAGDPDEDDDEEEDEEDIGDWGHVDPAEGNSPFPDSNDPSGPGSAV